MTPRTKVGIQAPDISLGGTNPKELERGHRQVIEAARELKFNLQMTYPHGRDYNTTERLERAVSRHRLHLDMVDALIGEHESIVGAILDQGRR